MDFLEKVNELKFSEKIRHLLFKYFKCLNHKYKVKVVWTVSLKHKDCF